MESYQVLILIIGILSIVFGAVVVTRPKIIKWVVGGYFVASGLIWIVRAFV